MKYHKRIDRLNRTSGQIIHKIKRGIEKESLRIDSTGRLSQCSHPSKLGSALTHPFITTDYSEALLELVTPTFHSCEEALGHLDELHRIVYCHIDDELLWVNSLPCLLGDESQIPIAEYGNSNIGRMKHIYRRGLALRYSRKMQIIAGIHYNFSVPNAFWKIFDYRENDRDFKDRVSNGYLAGIRNFHRYSWLLFYLFGASPAACGSFFNNAPAADLQKMDSHTYYGPHATTLRMSNYGYRNPVQSEIFIDQNTIEGYIKTLENTVSTPYGPYEKFGVKKNGKFLQLNTNLLQIENEYYSVIRPKRRIYPLEKPTVALQNRGVEYIEVRCLDLDPFEPIGLSLAQARFIDLFLMYCLLCPSSLFTDDEIDIITKNKNITVLQGRCPNIKLQKNGEFVLLRTWAMELLHELEPFAQVFDDVLGGDKYQKSIFEQTSKVINSELTPSGKILTKLQDNSEPFFTLAMKLAQQTKKRLTEDPPTLRDIRYYDNLAKESLTDQKNIEMQDDLSLDEFLKRYFSQ